MPSATHNQDSSYRPETSRGTERERAPDLGDAALPARTLDAPASARPPGREPTVTVSSERTLWSRFKELLGLRSDRSPAGKMADFLFQTYETCDRDPPELRMHSRSVLDVMTRADVGLPASRSRERLRELCLDEQRHARNGRQIGAYQHKGDWIELVNRAIDGFRTLTFHRECARHQCEWLWRRAPALSAAPALATAGAAVGLGALTLAAGGAISAGLALLGAGWAVAKTVQYARAAWDVATGSGKRYSDIQRAVRQRLAEEPGLVTRIQADALWRMCFDGQGGSFAKIGVRNSEERGKVLQTGWDHEIALADLAKLKDAPAEYAAFSGAEFSRYSRSEKVSPAAADALTLRAIEQGHAHGLRIHCREEGALLQSLDRLAAREDLPEFQRDRLERYRYAARLCRRSREALEAIVETFDMLHGTEMAPAESQRLSQSLLKIVGRDDPHGNEDRQHDVRGRAWALKDAARLACAFGWSGDPARFPELVASVLHLSKVVGEGKDWDTCVADLVPRCTETYFGMRDNRNPLEEIEILAKYLATFGAEPLPSLFSAFRGLALGEPVSKDLRALGVTSSGSEGVRQLRELRRNLLEEALASQAGIDVANPLREELLTQFSRFDVSEWRRNRHSFGKLASDFARSAAAGKVEPLSAGWQRGGFKAALLDREELQKFSFAEPCRSKMKELCSDLRIAAGLDREALLEREKSFLAGEIARMRIEPDSGKPSQGGDASKRAAGRERYMRELSKLRDSVSGADSHERLIRVLAETKIKETPELLGSMRRLLASRLEPVPAAQRSSLHSDAERVEDSKTKLAETINVFQHLILQEGLGGLELSQQGLKRVRAACKVDALLQDLARLQGIGTRGYTSFAAVPQRGLLGELSGYICDACWTRQDGLLAQHPNLVPLILVAGEGRPEARLAGAVLIIESRTADGEACMIMRGINPLQNDITKHSAKDFFERFVDEYLVPIAREKGVKKILMPWDPSAGGSQTNRPDLNLYLSQAYPKQPTIALAEPEGTRVNGYDISQKCVLVRAL